MKVLITGSAGHLGEALLRDAKNRPHQAIGVDLKPSIMTDRVGSITDPGFVCECLEGVDAVIHAATLHKPHVGTHSKQDFIDTNISGTLNLLQGATDVGVKAFIFTSTTSTFGDALRPAPGEPAVWVNEQLVAKPKNIYGVTKLAAEDLCQLFYRNHQLPTIVLRTSRFFLEDDDDPEQRSRYRKENLQVNELLYRRADIADMVSAHWAALERAPQLGHERLIISAASPFQNRDLAQLNTEPAAVVERYAPEYVDVYERLGWRMDQAIGRVYDSTRAQQRLDWQPAFNFADVITRLARGQDYRSDLAIAVGKKPYHNVEFTDGPYPLDECA